ncbi:MAG: SAM-dependent methyltransferase [Clostridia bacterium]|nr:SAM-dependent methyltransferase [Clostridia bacterium]
MTKRQLEIFRELDASDLTADIGCDHGVLSLELLVSNKAKNIISTDISQKCLIKTVMLLEQNGYTDRAEFVCADGLPSQFNPDQILIAGLGGLEICKILAQYFEQNPNRPKLVLQPMKDLNIVREFLNRIGYKIIADRIFEDRKFYTIIKAELGQQTLTKRQINFGAIEYEYTQDAYVAWLNEKIEKIQDILQKTSKNNSKYEELSQILNECNQIKGLKKC